jgi:microcystin-dependent protein
MRTSRIFIGAILALCLMLPASGYAQNQCWTFNTITNTWVYNPACGLTNPSPWNILSGKTFSILNTLTIKGVDNQTLDLTGLQQGNLQLGTAALAAASSFQPAGASIGYAAFSSTSLTIGTGTQTLSVPTGLSFATNMLVAIAYSSNAGIYMQGAVTSYNTNTGVLIVAATVTAGAGTYTAWNVSISGPQGPTGAAGVSGSPVGSVTMYAGASLPTGWLWSDGSCQSQATYPALFVAVGSAWNSADGCAGIADFGLPPMMGRVPIGAGQGATHVGGGVGTTRVLGTTGGQETMTTATMPTHNHTITDPGHSHIYDMLGAYGGLAGGASYNVSTSGATSTSTTGITVDNAGGGALDNIMSPFAVLNFIIKYQ